MAEKSFMRLHSSRMAIVLTAAFVSISIITASASYAVPKTMSAKRYLTRSAPVLISIPAIGVTSKFIKLGLDKTGALQVPTTGNVAGWYTGAPTPGELGPAIIVAHVDMGGKEGVFFHLKELKKGNLIAISRADGKIVKFVVTATSNFLKTSFPTAKIYGDINFAGLRLITCGGAFDSKTGHYLSNVVVFAKMVS
ncbi:MAG TPA: class F sortase [Candidatus Nanopelagicaceae bacterium]